MRPFGAVSTLRQMILGPNDGPSRLRLRRRLIVFSAPVVLVALLALLKFASVLIVGNAAVSDYTHRDADALRADISTLAVLNVIEPLNVPLARAHLAVLDGQLDTADSQFSDALSDTEASRSCGVRVDLELVRETRGDIAARSGRVDPARQHYTDALIVIGAAPAGCFAGNGDPDQDRRTVRDGAAARLGAKIEALHSPPKPDTAAPVSPSPLTPALPPPPQAAGIAIAPTPASPTPPGPVDDIGITERLNPDRLPSDGDAPALRLGPRSGNAFERLQDRLRNADASNPHGG